MCTFYVNSADDVSTACVFFFNFLQKKMFQINHKSVTEKTG